MIRSCRESSAVKKFKLRGLPRKVGKVESFSFMSLIIRKKGQKAHPVFNEEKLHLFFVAAGKKILSNIIAFEEAEQTNVYIRISEKSEKINAKLDLSIF